MPCGSQNKFIAVSHTLFRSPEKWSMDQLCTSNTLNKAHRGISSVYHHYPNSPHANEMNSRNSLPPRVSTQTYSTKKDIKQATMMDDTRVGQLWRWLISLSGNAGHSGCDRNEEKSRSGVRRGIHHTMATQGFKCCGYSSPLFMIPIRAWGCNNSTSENRFHLQETKYSIHNTHYLRFLLFDRP